MKKITLLLLLLFNVAMHSQSNLDIMNRSRNVLSATNRALKNSDTLKTADKAFAYNKYETLKETKIMFTAEQISNVKMLFESQYKPLAEVYSRFKEDRTPKTKLDLFTLFVKNEEDFRALLTPDQKLVYLRYQDKYSPGIDNSFELNFMDDNHLEIYKKEIK